MTLEERVSQWPQQWRQEGLEQGLAQGMEQGLAQGMEQGRAQGIEQGIEQGRAQGIEQGRVQGIEQGRALLCRLAARKFDAAAGEGLAAALTGVADPDRLAQVGDWIIECETGADLLARVCGDGRAGGSPGYVA